ncbi:MAG: GTPase Era [Saprospiraceae bacterium]|nr:GTPase Era [Saprospiraceae bacterium]
MHKSGFVNIIGRPNVGKSTLMNALVGERMSIITAKPQTTRHRIIGILSGDDFQIVFSDTPGYVRKPTYKMHEAMNSFVKETFEDADIMLFVTEPSEAFNEDDPIIQKLKGLPYPKFLVLNKMDKFDPSVMDSYEEDLNKLVDFQKVIRISALKKQNTEGLLSAVQETLPEGPEYYPKDQLTDRPERFFCAEIIREKILLNYRDEIPYACEVVIEDFKETQTNKGEKLARINATIFVGRDNQKVILIGKNGLAMKKLGMDARKDIEKFLDYKVFLEMTVKVRENWRDDEKMLKHFGYNM